MSFFSKLLGKISFGFSLVGLLGILDTVGSLAQAADPASEQRLEEVAQRGAQVMPFALDKTRHIFTKPLAVVSSK